MPSIAILGASKERSKFGNKCVRAYSDAGYKIFPINLKEKEIEGLKCYKSVLDVPGNIDIASVYILPAIGLKVADEIIKKGIGKVYLNPGSESERIISKLHKAGIEVLAKCSIVAIGKSPSQYS